MGYTEPSHCEVGVYKGTSTRLRPDAFLDRGMGVGEHRTSYSPPEVMQNSSFNWAGTVVA